MTHLAFTGIPVEHEGVDRLLKPWNLGRHGNALAFPCYLNHVAGRSVAETGRHSES